MLLLTVFLIIAQALYIIYLFLTWNHDYWRKRGLVTAKPLGLLGSYPGFLTGRSFFVDDVQRIYDKYKGKHRAVGVFFARQPQILVLDPQLAHEVLVKNFSDFRDTLSSSFIKPTKANKFVIRNPFFCPGHDWKKRRTDASAGLSPSKIKQAYAIWEQSGKKLLDFIERQVQQQGDVIEARDLCLRYNGDAMGDFIWGMNTGSLTGIAKEPNNFQQAFSKWTTAAFANMTLYFKLMMAPVVIKLMRLRFYPKETDDFFSQLTRDTVKLRLSAGSERGDYLTHLVQLMEQKGASHDDLVGYAMTVLLDGHETSSVALYNMLYTLAEYPSEQAKLRAEILEALEENETISYEQLSALPYLDQCVNESLRLASPIGQLTKICSKSTTIDVGNGQLINIEPGMQIMVPAYHYHYDEAYFPEPEVFKPERFENDAQQEFSKNGYFLPFGDGPRICLGMRVGLLSVKMAVLRILSKYELSVTEKVPKNFDSVFGKFLSGDINLRFKKLDQ